MLPTLKGGQILLAKKTNSFERGDIIVVKEEDNIIIKRIKYLPGEYYYTVLDFDTSEMLFIDSEYREMVVSIKKYGFDNIKKFKYYIKFLRAKYLFLYLKYFLCELASEIAPVAIPKFCFNIPLTDSIFLLKIPNNSLITPEQSSFL